MDLVRLLERHGIHTEDLRLSLIYYRVKCNTKTLWAVRYAHPDVERVVLDLLNIFDELNSSSLIGHATSWGYPMDDRWKWCNT